MIRSVLTMLLMAQLIVPLTAQSAPDRQVHTLKITALVTNVSGNPHEGDGEWGYSALVEVDGHKILYDTGASPDLVLKNAAALKIDLRDVEDVVLSHNHWDHVAGLMTLRRELMKSNPRAMSRVHVGARIFDPRLNAAGENQNGLRTIKDEYPATGGMFIVHDKPTEIFPGVWFTGPVPRPHDEKNWFPGLSLETANGRVEDNVPEDSALVFSAANGLVILSGCAHAGIVNIADYSVTIVPGKSLLAVVGGLHLFSASDEALTWTGQSLKRYNVQYLLAGHCSGIEPTYRLRESLGLNRKTAVVSVVGSSFTLGTGIDPRYLAQ